MNVYDSNNMNFAYKLDLIVQIEKTKYGIG